MLTKLSSLVALALIFFAWNPSEAQTPVEAGYRDFSYGTTGSATPTSEKPESKLWWNDGFWWGSLYNDVTQAYHIYWLDPATQGWVDTGTQLDDRNSAKADVLWDHSNGRLYVVSHLFTTSGAVTSLSSDWGRLYRYSYDPATKSYALDPGFPVAVTRGKSETLVAAKDSLGTLWVTYVQSGKVMVNRSLSSDLDWGEPFVLPVDLSAVSVSTDDISTVTAFQGTRSGSCGATS